MIDFLLEEARRRLLEEERMRLLEEARMILDMLSHLLRDGGPSMTRKEIKSRVDVAVEKINQVAPRTILMRKS